MFLSNPHMASCADKKPAVNIKLNNNSQLITLLFLFASFHLSLRHHVVVLPHRISAQCNAEHEQGFIYIMMERVII